MRVWARRSVGAVVALGAAIVLVLPSAAGADSHYPAPPDPDAEPIPPPADPEPEPTPAPSPRPAPAPDPDPDPEEEPTPAPVPDPAPTPGPTDPLPSPEPSPEPPVVEPGGGTGERDGEPIEIRIRPAPPSFDPDDPVTRIVPGVRPSDDGERVVGLPPREDGTPREPDLDAVVLVEAGPLGIVMTGESCTGESLAVDPSGALRTSPGGSIIIAAGGFLGNAEVATWLYSDPMLLAREVTLADGTVVKTGRVPDDVMVGRHVSQVNGVGGDGAPYRVSLDVMVVDCVPGEGLRGVPGGLAGVLSALLALLLLAGRGWLLAFRRVRRIKLVAYPGWVPIAVERRAVASQGRRPVDAELRGGPVGLEPRDRALEATGLRLAGTDVLDLDRAPVPVAATVVVEAAGATWILAVRRPDGTFEPVTDDGLPRLIPGATLVMTVDGARRAGRLEVTLESLRRDEDDRQGIEAVVLGESRADADGRGWTELALPADLGSLPLVVGLRFRGR